MVINFSDLLSKKNRKKQISLSFELEPFEFEGEEIRAIEKVSVEGVAISENDVIVINASIKTKLKLNCSRCLDTFIYPIDIDIEERFTNNKELDSEEIMFVDGDTLTRLLKIVLFQPYLSKDFARKTVRDYVLNAVQIKMLKIVVV